MARKSKGPWYWKVRGQWVVNIRGKRHYLGPDRKAAYQKWHTLSATPEQNIAPDSVVVLLDQFLDWCQLHRPASYDWYKERINAFAKTIPDVLLAELKPFHVQRWIDTKKSNGHKRGCLISVHRALNWAVKQGLIAENPLRHMEKPPAGKRELVIELAEFETIIGRASDQQFRDLLTFCWETGCRPQEVVRLEARHLDAAHKRCVFPELESKGKKKKRVIYCTDTAWAILERLKGDGRLFRNADGKPWKPNNVACRFSRMKRHVGKQLCLYHLRHSWMTRMLKKGVDPITVATLAGHSDPSMLAKIYAHIQNDTDHLRAALVK